MCPALLSNCLSIGPLGLMRLNLGSGLYYAVHGFKTYSDSDKILPLTNTFPINMKNNRITQAHIDDYDMATGERFATSATASCTAILVARFFLVALLASLVTALITIV